MIIKNGILEINNRFIVLEEVTQASWQKGYRHGYKNPELAVAICNCSYYFGGSKPYRASKIYGCLIVKKGHESDLLKWFITKFISKKKTVPYKWKFFRMEPFYRANVKIIYGTEQEFNIECKSNKQAEKLYNIIKGKIEK